MKTDLLQRFEFLPEQQQVHHEGMRKKNKNKKTHTRLLPGAYQVSWKGSPKGSLSVPAVPRVQLNFFTLPVCSPSESLTPRTDGRRRQQIVPAQRTVHCWGWSSSSVGLLAWWGTPALLPVEPADGKKEKKLRFVSMEMITHTAKAQTYQAFLVLFLVQIS